MGSKFRNSLGFFLFISLFSHSLLYISLYFHPGTSKDMKPLNTIEIDFVSMQDPSEKKTMQLIEQEEKQWNDEVPEDTQYLGRHNQSVKNETKASRHGDFRNAPGSDGNESGFKPPTEEPQKETIADTSQVGSIPRLSELKPQFEVSQRPPDEYLPDDFGGPGSQTNDHLPDVQPNIETLLNSREFVYYTYYQRIRSQIRQYWEPSIREKVRKVFAQGRSIASTRDHITQVIIVLDQQGSLLGVKVVGESGIQDLDEAAVEAFRAAEPFPNPPKGIVEADGTIKIRWDFVLETSASISTPGNKESFT